MHLFTFVLIVAVLREVMFSVKSFLTLGEGKETMPITASHWSGILLTPFAFPLWKNNSQQCQNNAQQCQNIALCMNRAGCSIGFCLLWGEKISPKGLFQNHHYLQHSPTVSGAVFLHRLQANVRQIIKNNSAFSWLLTSSRNSENGGDAMELPGTTHRQVRKL